MKTIIIDGVEYQLTPIEEKAKEAEIFSDWRLPSIHELLTLINYGKPGSEELLTLYDKSMDSYYWSSIAHTSNDYYAWSVAFEYGFSSVANKYYIISVRFCRDGNNGLEWSETVGKMSWDQAMKFAKTYAGPVTFRSEK
jgi:hypothetical protein